METNTNTVAAVEPATAITGEWCRECRAYVHIADQQTETEYTAAGEHAFRVNYYECGHTEELPNRTPIGCAPGHPRVAGTVANLAAFMRGVR